MNKLSQFGILIVLLAFTLINCTNQNNKKQDATITDDQSVVDMHTSEISLDWAGVYEGTMPCADCEGIETVVELKDNHTFTATYNYLGEGDKAHTYTNKGTFTWDDSGQVITLQANDENSQYRVGENHITLLNADGEVNTGKLAAFYVLQKKM